MCPPCRASRTRQRPSDAPIECSFTTRLTTPRPNFERSESSGGHPGLRTSPQRRRPSKMRPLRSLQVRTHPTQRHARSTMPCRLSITPTSPDNPGSFGSRSAGLLGSKAKTAEQTWKEKSGTGGDDLAILFLALARAAGLEVYAVQGHRPQSRCVRSQLPRYLSVRCAHRAPSHRRQRRLSRPRRKALPLRTTPLGPCADRRHRRKRKRANLHSAQQPQRCNHNAHSADLTVDARGNLAGTVKILMNGPSALTWRQLNLIAGEDEFRKQVAASLPTLLPAGVA